MKKRHLIVVLIILGSWISLHAAENLIGRLVTSKEQACERIEYQIEIGKCEKTNDIDNLYLEKRNNGLQKSSTLLLVGLLVLTLGLLLYIKDKKRKTVEIKFSPNFVINLVYWVLFIYGVGFLVSEGWTNIDSCAIEWIYIFLMAASVGFYGGYYFIPNKPDIRLINARFVIRTFLISGLGGLVSYFPIGVISAVSTGNYLTLFSIPYILAIGFFCFVSFVNVFIGFFIRKYLIK